MLRKVFDWCGLRSLFWHSFVICKVEDRAVEAHQQVGAEDDLPPALNLGIVRDAIIGPAKFIFRVLETCPGSFGYPFNKRASTAALPFPFLHHLDINQVAMRFHG